MSDPIDLNIENPFSKIIKDLDLKLGSPLDKDVGEYLENSYNFSKCPFGNPKLDYYCSLAYKNKNDTLLCGGILNWSEHLQVEGLRACFNTMKYDMKLGEANRRRKGNFKGASYKKVNRP
tara:strand:- start:268 stop:627 length:360 start_codon:yes stop_codon:yes gene_type:complete